MRPERDEIIVCTGVERDADGEPALLRCTYHPATRGGSAPDGRKVRGTIHWVSASHAARAEVRLYDHLFSAPEPGAAGDFLDDLNPDSLTVLRDCRVEPSLAESGPEAVQFERQGYFCADPDSRPGRPVFNRVAGLRDSWARIREKGS